MDFPRDPSIPTLTEAVERAYVDAISQVGQLPIPQHREAIRALAVRLLEESERLSVRP